MTRLVGVPDDCLYRSMPRDYSTSLESCYEIRFLLRIQSFKHGQDTHEPFLTIRIRVCCCICYRCGPYGDAYVSRRFENPNDVKRMVVMPEGGGVNGFHPTERAESDDSFSKQFNRPDYRSRWNSTHIFLFIPKTLVFTENQNARVLTAETVIDGVDRAAREAGKAGRSRDATTTGNGLTQPRANVAVDSRTE